MSTGFKVTMEKIINLAKRRGFVFPGSEIYGGLANTWDFGPQGVELKNNIKNSWWKRFVHGRFDIVGLDSSILMNPKVWEASGHIESFTDPLIECKVCHERFRADKDDYKEHEHQDFTPPQNFQMMFKTFIGPVEAKASTVYLRPETAQGMFVNYKNVLDTDNMKVPFGIAQIGKSFRNEITAGNFIFRDLEFEIAEFEYFVKPGEDEKIFNEWLEEQMAFLVDLGLKKENLRYYEHPKDSLAHYSKRTVDIEYNFPFGWQELTGLANRTDYDLKRHMEYSGKDLTYRDPASGEVYVPFVIEPTFGIERLMLAVMCDAYTEITGGRTTTTDSTKEVEMMMKFKYILAPYKVAVLPLSKKDELIKVSREVFNKLSNHFATSHHTSQSIGRRYRREDEIGTPFCVTVDFDTLNDQAVTIRDRDTMAQERVGIDELAEAIKNKLNS